jgi:hypothetical protein
MRLPLTALVSTAVMGTRDILGPGRVAVAAYEDEADFATCVTRLLRDPLLRARLSAEGREGARCWNACALAERTDALDRTVLDRAGRREGEPMARRDARSLRA